MTVGELIERLKAFPADLPVIVNGGRNENANGKDVKAVGVALQSRSPGLPWAMEYYPDVPTWDDEERREAVNVTA